MTNAFLDAFSRSAPVSTSATATGIAVANAEACSAPSFFRSALQVGLMPNFGMSMGQSMGQNMGMGAATTTGYEHGPNNKHGAQANSTSQTTNPNAVMNSAQQRSLGDVRQNIDRILFNLASSSSSSSSTSSQVPTTSSIVDDVGAIIDDDIFSVGDTSETAGEHGEAYGQLHGFTSACVSLSSSLNSASASTLSSMSSFSSSVAMSAPSQAFSDNATTGDNLQAPPDVIASHYQQDATMSFEPLPIDTSRVTIVPKLKSTAVFQDNSLMDFFDLLRTNGLETASTTQSSGDDKINTDSSSSIKQVEEPRQKRRKTADLSAFANAQFDFQLGSRGVVFAQQPLAHVLKEATATVSAQEKEDAKASTNPSSSSNPSKQTLSPTRAPLATTSQQNKKSSKGSRRTPPASASATAKTQKSGKPAAKKELKRKRSTNGSLGSTKIRCYQELQWEQRFTELTEYKNEFGHCCVPYGYPQNRVLAQWVKRQRYQLRLRLEGRHSTMTMQRQQKLDDVGFCWDSHAAQWEERFQELLSFKAEHGHCLVPVRYSTNQQLAIWVKCQRRQYKLLKDGKPSNITDKRITRLNQMGFVWSPRGGTN